MKIRYADDLQEFQWFLQAKLALCYENAFVFLGREESDSDRQHLAESGK